MTNLFRLRLSSLRSELRVEDSRSPQDLVLPATSSAEPSEHFLRFRSQKQVTVFANRSTKVQAISPGLKHLYELPDNKTLCSEKTIKK